MNCRTRRLPRRASYPRQNSLALALRELGRIERTIFTLDWMRNAELRRRVQIGLNKGEAKNALTRAVFLNRLGEIRDCRFGTSATVPAVSTWWWPPSSCGIEFTWRTGRQGAARFRRHRRRGAADAHGTAGVGAYRPDRRLPLAAEQAGRTGPIPAAPKVGRALAFSNCGLEVNRHT